MEEIKETNAIDEADLEDGEIETDEENEIVEPTPAAKEKPVSADNESKKTKISSDEDVSSSKKTSSKHSKGEHHHRKSSSKATNNGGGGGGSSSSKKHTSEASVSARKPNDGNLLFNNFLIII